MMVTAIAFSWSIRFGGVEESVYNGSQLVRRTLGKKRGRESLFLLVLSQLQKTTLNKRLPTRMALTLPATVLGFLLSGFFAALL